MKQNVEDKTRQEDTRFGGCQGKNPRWGKPFDQFFLLLYQNVQQREYKRSKLTCQIQVKTAL